MKRYISLLLVLIMAVSLCACGSAKSESYSSAAYVEAPAAAPSYAYASEEAAVDHYANGLAASGSTVTADAAQKQEVNPDKIIYSADATVETTDFDRSIAELNDMIKQYGGWIESSSINGSNYYNKSRGNSSTRSASYTVRIPSENFQTLMSGLSTLGNIPYTHTYTQNVTAQYYDTQARLTAYQAQETRLLEMMEIAETVEDIITIEDKLAEVRYMIESLQSSLNNWDRRVNYSTVDITVNEVREYTPSSPVKITYAQRLKNAFVDSIDGAVEFLQDLLVFLVSMIPTIVILGVLLFVFRPLLKKLLPKWKEKRAAHKEAKAAKKAAKKNKEQ